MVREQESHFSTVPSIEKPRSTFDRSTGHTTSFNVGDVIPVYWTTIYPGDTVKMRTSCVLRLQTLLTPIMGNIVVDIFWHFSPYRILWNHTKEFYGENTTSPWAQQTQYTVPKIKSPSNGFASGTIADYLGVPPNVVFDGVTDDLLPDAFPFRAYASFCNEYMRDQNLTDPLTIPTGDATQQGSNGTNYITDVANGGMPFKAARFHDLFSSCLPDPQKRSTPVTFPLISGSRAPVYPGTDRWFNSSSPSTGVHYWTESNISSVSKSVLGINTGGDLKKVEDSGITAGWSGAVVPDNLYADLSTSVGSVTVNQLRLAFQMQRFYEAMARQGSRYREIIHGMFGTTLPDARALIPEYLGGNRFPIQIHQITNNSSDAASGNYLGDLGAMSNTSDIHDDFVSSFTEPGILMCCAVVRYDHVVSQGLSPEFVHSDYLSYYWPTLANIGEQPVYKWALDATVRNGNPRMEVFGYNEAWSDKLRYMPSRVSGEMRPGVSNSLASWHLADYYTQTPTLSDAWIREDKTNVDRTLAVTSQVANQVMADFWFDAKFTRVLPMYSVPGLIDHF